MTDKNEQAKTGATELKEEELEKAQGGVTAPGDVADLKGKKVLTCSPGSKSLFLR